MNGSSAPTALQHIPNRFAEAIGRHMDARGTDTLIEKYIDPSVKGSDRTLAHGLMRMMPVGMRGDFLYYDGKRLLSNNPALIPYAQFVQRPKPSTVQSIGKGTNAASVGRQGAANRHTSSAGQCSPPDPYGGTGPYVRMVGNCGFNGGWGVVKLPCNTTHLAKSTEGGYMYFETRDQAGNLFEAGAFTKDGAVIDPYEAHFSQQLNNANARYQCGNYLGILAGLINAPVPGQTVMYWASIGTIVNYNPQNAFSPTETITENNPAWFFIVAPGNNFNQASTDAAGVPTRADIARSPKSRRSLRIKATIRTTRRSASIRTGTTPSCGTK
jgi:hypothetical protein